MAGGRWLPEKVDQYRVNLMAIDTETIKFLDNTERPYNLIRA